MLMRLKKSNLESLLKAIQSKGADPGGCVMFPSMASCLGMSAHVLLCQLFRWPDLQSDYDLKRLHSFCSLNNEPCKMQDLSIQSKLYECCNPYHWSRVMTALDQAGKKWAFFSKPKYWRIHEWAVLQLFLARALLDGFFSFIQTLWLELQRVVGEAHLHLMLHHNNTGCLKKYIFIHAQHQ